MSYKAKLSLAALCMLASGVASAATDVGSGSLTVNGTIGASTCTVAPSVSSITVPLLNPTAITAAAVDSEMFSKTVNFDFTDCTAAGNTMIIKMSRDVTPPTGTTGGDIGALYTGGFTYTGGTSTDSTKGPLYYKIMNGNKSLRLDSATNTGDPNNSFDISSVTDKNSFSLPVDFKIYKAPVSSDAASMFAGAYVGNVAWSIEYP